MDRVVTTPPLPTSDDAPASQEQILSWRLQDFERLLFFPGSKHTHANALLTLLMGLLLSAVFYGIVITLRPRIPALAAVWLERGWVPYSVCVFFFWGMSSLFIKWRKLALQRKALFVRIVPDELGFVLSPQTADQVLRTLHSRVDDPDAFILFNRVRRAVMSLKNIGRVSDVETIVRSQSDGDANTMDTSYTLVKGFLWAMPVLGFIGTVQGLSTAIGEFGSVLTRNAEVSGLRDSLKSVVLGLSIAFDTTLVALVCTLILQLFMSFLRKKEEDFLEDCDDYCHRSVVSKLRLLGHEGRD